MLQSQLKFCPKCGTPKSGRFCGGCGFAFDAVIVPDARAMAQAPKILGEWRVDPINPSQERYWDGNAWTNDVRIGARRLTSPNASFVTSKAETAVEAINSTLATATNLLYGEDFSFSKNCSNCGEPRKVKATNCALCEEIV